MGVHGKLVLGESHTRKIADAHKAALTEATDANQQLSAERRKREREMADYETLCNDLRQQLAAVREKVQTYEGALIKIANDPNCDRCQVAVDALAKVMK